MFFFPKISQNFEVKRMNINQNSYLTSNRDFKIQSWLLEAKISAGAKFTYSVLAICTGGQDHTWTSQETLSEKSSFSVRTIQRHIKELIECGLIEKARKWIGGKVRCIYYLLAPYKKRLEIQAKKSFSEQYDIMSCCSNKSEKNSKIQPSNSQIQQEQHDTLAVSINKEESYIENNPPTPHADEPKEAGLAFCDSNQGGEDSELEDSDLALGKTLLRDVLTPNEYETWIKPLIFEKTDSALILRCPNKFFREFFKNKHEELLNKAFKTNCHFEIMTDEEQKRFESSLQKRLERSIKPIKPIVKAEEVQLDSLPIEEQFEKLFNAYPRNYEGHNKAIRAFKRLKNRPSAEELMRAIKKQIQNNPSWHRENGRFVPQFSRWLSEERWLD
ncbi:MAG: helix-turn-helix domain-containing protein [Candidatus Adiutrix sp.]